VKDLFPRHRAMKGYDVLRKAGWDTHGLPVELEVEKLLGLDGKPQIEAYGIEPFIDECKKSVWKYKGDWERMSERVGFWADMEHPYVTYENDYIESVWWSLKTIADKGLLYKGHKVVPYCPRCGTVLSSHEVAQGYEEVTEPSAFVRFAVKGRPNTYLLAWTTTPWTLPSNVALCVNANEDYCELAFNGETLIFAKALVSQVLGEEAAAVASVTRTFKGKELFGTEYEPLFHIPPSENQPGKKAWFVVCDPYVTLTDGSGIVHIAPAFGEDDGRLGREHNLLFLQPVDAQGKFDASTPWDGLFVKDADPKILAALQEAGLLFQTTSYTHNYPHCWRCHTPLLYYARGSWFIRMSSLRKELAANNRSIDWLPDNIKEGRMGDFVENVLDWGLSRERYWGTPLPIWTCECAHTHVIGSRAELRDMGGDVPEGLDLHRPYIDRVTFPCPACGGEMRRVPEVIDCWYDSGSMPFAQWHYPFENREIFERRFPAHFISEAIDQTRGWFYTLLAISTCLFGRSCFEHCIVLGHVQDKDGQKMSKHKGNMVDPWTALDAQGADAVRWYFYTNGAPWLPSRFYAEAVSESQRKFMGTLWNTYAFFVLYANIDGFDPNRHPLEKAELTLMDRWVLSRLHTLIREVDDGLDRYRVTEPARAIEAFVDELSNWYVRRSRERFWGKGMAGDKEAAFATLYTVLETLARLIAPFTPFMAEAMYVNLVRSVRPDAPESVHLCDYPQSDPNRIDAQLEANMDALLRVVQLGRACRNAANIKTRQPSAAVYAVGVRLPDDFSALAADELNVKEVAFPVDTREFTTYKLKPQLRTLGPRYGKLLGKISGHLNTLDGNDVAEAFSRGETLDFEMGGTPVSLAKDDVLAEPMQRPGFTAESDRGVTVVLDTNLTPELLDEGFAREVISKLQTMRKEAGFEVTDRVVVCYEADAELARVIAAFEPQIVAAVLADSLQVESKGEGWYQKEWNINGLRAVLGIKRVDS
ncbi:MAG: isoleucine--tRNA ligase, partial [Clostridia bacterium]|nr:isoleucine--tRNA ligase [Clostridia bacterium]